MMTLTSIEAVPTTFAVTFPSGVAELMVALLLISALGIAAGVLRRTMSGATSKRERGTAPFMGPVARQTAAA